MQPVSARFIRVLFALAAVVGSAPALAGYAFSSIDYPGSTDTQVFGVNNNGQVVGTGFDSNGDILATFVYDSKKGGYTAIAPAPGSVDTQLLDINESGVTVGGVSFDGTTRSGFVRSKKGAYTVFSHPDCVNTNARAINSKGLVSGYADTCSTSDSVGFIYDPARDTFVDFLPDQVRIAHGINSRGEVVGDVVLDAGVACTGCLAGRYGFVRAASGAVAYFQVNGMDTRPRGISDSGVIAGFVVAAGTSTGFVTKLAGLPYQSITIPPAALLQYPGAVSTNPEGITNAGAIVGIWNDEFNFSHGFIATP
jgi:hypothetical protein